MRDCRACWAAGRDFDHNWRECAFSKKMLELSETEKKGKVPLQKIIRARVGEEPVVADRPREVGALREQAPAFPASRSLPFPSPPLWF